MKKLLLPMLLTLACASNVKTLSEEYETVKGTLAAPPILEDGGNRLILYIKTEKKTEEKNEIVVAAAENDEKGKVLVAIKDKLLLSPSETVFLYGYPVQGQWREYIDGIDFEFVAIGVYEPNTKNYQVILATYGTRARDAVSNISWSDFIKTVFGAAIKKAL